MAIHSTFRRVAGDGPMPREGHRAGWTPWPLHAAAAGAILARARGVGPSVLVGAAGGDLLPPLGVPLCFALLVGGHGPTPVGRLRALLGRLRPALGHLC